MKPCPVRPNYYFFNIEPYKSFREYFNVYMIAAVSEEEGVSEEIPGRKVNNRFGSTFGEGTDIQWDEKDMQELYRPDPRFR